MSDPVYIGYDTETHLIQPGLLAPPLVVASVCPKVENGGYLQLRDEAVDFFEAMLDQPTVHLVIHNAAFDLGVLCEAHYRKHGNDRMLRKVFTAVRAGRIHCTRIRDMMLHNAAVGLSDDNGPAIAFHLSDLVQRRLGLDITADKTGDDVWRLRYDELDDKPLAEWPAEAKRYAIDDAIYHLRVFEDQELERVKMWEGIDPLADELGQMKGAWALHLMGAYGVRTDEAAIDALEAELHATVDVANTHLKACGLLKGASKLNKETGLREVTWSKNLTEVKARVERLLGDRAPRTAPSGTFPEGQVKTDEETLLLTGDPDLKVLADVGTDAKVLSTYVPALKGLNKKGNSKTYEQKGMRLPGGWLLNAFWNILVATGRTSCARPNLQNPPKKGGVRECFIPRPGFWYCSTDYSFIELVTWAQTCYDLFGFSDLRDSINAGRDPHVDAGVDICRADDHVRDLSYTDKAGKVHTLSSAEMTYDFLNAARKAGAEWAKEYRQLAKALNFGLPGGLGAATFVAYAAATYNVHITEDKSRDLKVIWMKKWREARLYFAHISTLSDRGGENGFVVTLPRTGFVRGGCRYTSGANTYFQGLAARGAKEALFDVAEECYVTEDSPLYGCRPVMFLHDEIIVEVPAERQAAHEASMRLVEVMVAAMRRFTPDVKVAAEPALMDRWRKEAEPVWGTDGVLELWTPKGVA